MATEKPHKKERCEKCEEELSYWYWPEHGDDDERISFYIEEEGESVDVCRSCILEILLNPTDSRVDQTVKKEFIRRLAIAAF